MHKKIYGFLIVNWGYLIFGNVYVLSMNIQNQQLCIRSYDVFQYRQKGIDEKGVKLIELKSVEQRTFYGAKECDFFGITLESSEQLSPEDFCVKVAQIAARYDLNKPVIPLINLKVKSAGGDPEGVYVWFSEKYTIPKEGFSEVDFIVGHELGHRKYWNEEFNLASKNMKILNYKGFALLCGLLFLLLYNDTSRFSFVVSILPMLTYDGIKYFYTRRCHKVELACDEYAVTHMRGTREEKIEVAQEGINSFKKITEESLLRKIESYIVHYMPWESTHPSPFVRIKNLQRIIDELNKQKE